MPRPHVTSRTRRADAASDHAQLEALVARAGAEVPLPADACVLGAPVRVVAIGYDGHPRRGLTATCHRGDARYVVGLADVVFTPGSEGARFAASYRAWLASSPSRARRRKQVASSDVGLSAPLDLVVLACKAKALRCRVPGSPREITLRTAVRDEVPGEIVTVVPTRQWTRAGHPYLAGTMTSCRLDVAMLGLTPLQLRPEGEWDPDDEYWGEEHEPLPAWAMPIIARGKRPMFEMEQVIPGADPEDFDADPIVDAVELDAAGARAESRELLMSLLARDLRCLDAHAHLGNLEFDHRPRQALRHYAAGVAIGELALGAGFDGVLAWGLLDNRPFLRCLHGAGISSWRLGRFDAAAATFRRMLWLNPSDNQGARFNLANVEAGRTWTACEKEAP